jgi:hypothetical protein
MDESDANGKVKKLDEPKDCSRSRRKQVGAE